MGVRHMEPDGREAVVATLAEQLAGRTDIAFACLFGSFLSPDGFRDVDLAIWATPEAASTVDLDLAVHLSRRLDLPVDVRRVNDAPVPFLFHALRGRVVAARDQRLLADVMERTARSYHDLAPRLRRATREAFAP